jgi:hypothetical protein
MGLLDKLTGKERREQEARQAAEAKAKREAKRAEKLAKKKADEEAQQNDPKALATKNGEPWVQVLSMEIDKDNPGQGAFELDWNDIFVARLIKSGYQGKTDQDIVDNWFQDVCRNVVMETYQQEMADPSNRPSNRKDLGDGRVEIS